MPSTVQNRVAVLSSADCGDHVYAKHCKQADLGNLKMQYGLLFDYVCAGTASRLFGTSEPAVFLSV